VGQVCFLLVGINDVRGGVPLEVIKLNIKAIINIALQSAEGILVSTLPPTLHAPPAELHAISEINQYIVSFQRRRGVVIVPFHRHFPPFSSAAQSSQLYQGRYFNGRPDNIHLSRRGLLLLLRLVRELCANSGLQPSLPSV